MKLVGICGSPREVKNGAKMGQKRGQGKNGVNSIFL